MNCLRLLSHMLLLLISCIFVGCGVKGDPQPPLSPAVLGHGEPTYHKATEKIKIKKKDSKNKSSTAKEDDWEELDFIEDGPK